MEGAYDMSNITRTSTTSRGGAALYQRATDSKTFNVWTTVHACWGCSTRDGYHSHETYSIAGHQFADEAALIAHLETAK